MDLHARNFHLSSNHCYLNFERNCQVFMFLVNAFVSKICLSAYADDITVIVNHNQDIKRLSEFLNCYEKASSAKGNFIKSEASWVGQGHLERLP